MVVLLVCYLLFPIVFPVHSPLQFLFILTFCMTFEPPLVRTVLVPRLVHTVLFSDVSSLLHSCCKRATVRSLSLASEKLSSLSEEKASVFESWDWTLDSETFDLVPWDSGPGPWDPGPGTRDPGSLDLARIQKIKFRDVFFPFLCQK